MLENNIAHEKRTFLLVYDEHGDWDLYIDGKQVWVQRFTVDADYTQEHHKIPTFTIERYVNAPLYWDGETAEIILHHTDEEGNTREDHLC